MTATNEYDKLLSRTRYHTRKLERRLDDLIADGDRLALLEARERRNRDNMRRHS